MFMEIPNDDTVGDRLCLKCGIAYNGKHSDCPHAKSKITGANPALASFLSIALNIEH